MTVPSAEFEMISGGARELWTPAAISPALWLDPSDSANRTIVSSAYSGLTDLSGNGNDAVQATAANRPALSVEVINGLDAMHHDGVNDYLIVPDDATLQFGTGDFFQIAVVQFDNVSKGPTAQNTIISKYFNGFELFNYQGQDGAYAGGTENSTGLFGALSNAAPYLIDSRRSSSSFTVAIDSTRSTPATNSANASNIGQDLLIGFRPGAASNHTMLGYIGEIIIAVTDIEKAQGYLAHKWGTTASLPGGHPYKTEPPYL